MPVIYTRPAGVAGKSTYAASEILNDSTVSGVSVKDALDFLSTGGFDVGRFVFNQPLTTISGNVFSIPDTPASGTVQVFINGLLQEPGPGKDYLISGTVITFAGDIYPKDILLAHYIKLI